MEIIDLFEAGRELPSAIDIAQTYINSMVTSGSAGRRGGSQVATQGFNRIVTQM